MHHDPTGGDAHGARTMTSAELAERIRPLLDHTDPGWHAVIDGYPSATATRENLIALWAYAVGAGYAIAIEGGVDEREAAELAFRVARDELAALGHHLETGQEEL